MISDQIIRIIVVILLFIILACHAGFLIILYSNYKRSRVDTTKAVLVLFVALTAMFFWKTIGFFARIFPEHPEFITFLLIADVFILLFIIIAEFRFLNIVCGFSLKEKFRSWLDAD